MSKHFMPRAPLAVLLGARPAAVIGAVRNDVDPGKLEKLLGDVKSELTRVGDEVKQTAEKALAEAKTAGEVSAEVKGKADELLTAQAKLGEAHTKIEQRLEALNTRNTDLEQRLSSRRGGGGEDAKTLGQMVCENDKLKAFAEGGAKGSLSVTVQNAITTSAGSAGALVTPMRETEIVRMPRRQLFIRQLLQVGPVSSTSVEYGRMTLRDNQANVVAEGAQKPESNYEWELADAPVRTIAHWVPVSRQAMDDIPMLQGEIDGELRYGLDYVEEAQILKGDGVGQNLHGLVPQASAYADQGIVVQNATKIDILRLAILQASLAEYQADGIAINDKDWADIELTKDGDNRYIFASVVQMAGPQLWGRPVIASQGMDEDEFLVGAFLMAAKIYDRMDTEVLISSEDRDNFIKNMLTVRCGEALGARREASSGSCHRRLRHCDRRSAGRLTEVGSSRRAVCAALSMN